jgi:hypothetical protein
MADTDSKPTPPPAPPEQPKDRPTLAERARRLEREILNAFTVQRQTSLADGAGAPGSTAAGDNRAGLPHGDQERGKRD